MRDKRRELTPEQYQRVKAVLGIDAATFKSAPLGEYIFDRIDVEEEKLIEALVNEASNSTDKHLVQIALNIQMHRMLPKFIEEAIGAGHAAEDNLNQMDARANSID